MSVKRGWCGAGVTALCLLLPGCLPPLCDSLEPAPPIDWQEVALQAGLALDVTHSATVSDEELVAKYGGPGLDLIIRRVPKDGDRYLIILDAAQQVQTVVVPGTNLNNRNDILSDLSIHLAFDPELGINVDTGFRGTARALLSDAAPFLKTGFATNLYGYSLGGAVAALLGAYMEHDGYLVNRIVTFGQPKLTDVAGAQELAVLPLMRFKAARDLVPDIPAGTYQQFGPEIILLDGPFFVYLTSEDRNYGSSTELVSEVLAADVLLGDHFTYGSRTASKVPGPNTQVSFCERQMHEQTNVPADVGSPAP
jgi:triacylglycerol lipase